MSVTFTNIAVLVVGLVFVIWPATMMTWHRTAWSWFVGERMAGNVAERVFMPPRYLFPRVLGAAFAVLGLWLLARPER